MSNEGDWVLDPFLGTGTSIIAAIRHGRKGAGAETLAKYVRLARKRINQEQDGTLRTRPMHKPVYEPHLNGNKLCIAPWDNSNSECELPLVEMK